MRDFNKVSAYVFGELTIVPDYEKFTVADLNLQPIYTEWEEINVGQQKLVDL